MKHLPKHLRPRWRYLAVAVETWPDASFDRRGFQRAVWYAAQNLFGDVGSAEVGLTVLRFERWDGGGVAIVRTRRGKKGRARAVLACINDVDGDDVGVRVRGTSGTVRACEENYIHRPREPPDKRHVVFEDERKPAFVRGGAVDVNATDTYAGATTLDFQ